MTEPDEASFELDDFLGTAPRAAWRRWLLWVAIAIGGVSLGLLAMRFANGGQAASYISAPVVTGDLPVSLAVTGTLAASATSVAGSTASGVVTDVLVEIGDSVEKGQLLARLDPKPFHDAISKSRQGLAESLQALTEMRAIADQKAERLQLFMEVRRRSKGLAPSNREMVRAQAEQSSANDAATAAARAVDRAQADLAARIGALVTTEIRSPSDGVITQSNARQGQRGALLFIIAAPYSELNLDAKANTEAALQLNNTAAAHVTVADLPGRVFPGQLLGYSADGQHMLLRVTSDGSQLQPGMIAAARFGLGVHKGVLVVPNAALQFAQASDARRQTSGGSAIYVLESDGSPRRVRVAIRADDGVRTEIAPGALKAGMRVILGLR